MRPIYRLGHTLFRTTAEAFFDLRAVGREHIVESGGVLAVANHVSYFDPPLIGSFYEKEIHFVARKSLFNHPFLDWLLTSWNSIPIDRDQPDLATIRRILHLLKSGERVLMFPEGQRSRDGGLLPGQAGVGMMVARASVPIQPIRMFGAYHALPRGGRFPRRSTITIVYGAPFTVSKEQAKELGNEGVAQLVMGRIAELRAPVDQVEP